MKKVILSLAIIGLINSGLQAQGLLSKLKGNKEKTEEAASTTATDEWGISGNYNLSSPWEIDGKKVKSVAVVFIREENGTIVNRLEIKLNKDREAGKFNLNEKLMEKMNMKLFKGGFYMPNYTEFEVLQLDNGVLFLNSLGQKGYAVLAKNADDLKTWDEETGLAKYEAEKKKVNAAAAGNARKKLDNNETFKRNVGKVVFMNNRFEAGFGEPYPADVYKSFITESTTGKVLWFNAYFDKSIEEACKNCDKKLNYVYEMGKHKVDHMQLRSSGSRFSSMSVPSTLDPFSLYGGAIIYNGQTFSTAANLAIYNNIKDGTLKPGASMPLKITVYAYGDKTNVVKLAEGSISIKYDPNDMYFKMHLDALKDLVD